jgi:hypothetical protein
LLDRTCRGREMWASFCSLKAALLRVGDSAEVLALGKGAM